MPRITAHSKERLIQRDENVNTVAEAKRTIKQAWTSGQTVGNFQRYPRFFSYLTNKRDQSNTCSIRVYHGNIYIWRGRNRSLVTAHPIPDRYIEEMRMIDEGGESNGRESAEIGRASCRERV